MRLCVIGTGYVGLVSGACLADVGNTVSCVDKDKAKVETLKGGRSIIYEPGLEEIVRKNESEGRLFYTTDLREGISGAEVIFITVDTPPGADGRADLTNVLAVANKIGEILDHKTIVVTKSTVPVGTTMRVKESISAGLLKRGLDPKALLDVASNPEFLKEGDAINDFMKPDRVIVGVEHDEVAEKLHNLYKPFMCRTDRFLKMSIQSAELAKYAANAMLATRISFMNEMARLCERVGADIGDIRHALGSDPRIGAGFLYAGLGYGGSCFPKDARAVVELSKEHGAHLTVVDAADRTNAMQREWFWERIASHFGGEAGLAGKLIAIWGLSFKANTDDVRYAPSLYFVERLIEAGASIVVFDPIAMDSARTTLGKSATSIRWALGAYEAIEGADALIVCTEWREFRSPDFEKIKTLMRAPVIFDGRNLYDAPLMREMGYVYTGIGRPTTVSRNT